MLAKFQKSAYRLLMKISAGWGVEILLLWIFLPAGCGNSVALDISADWGVEILLLWIFLSTGVWKFCCFGYFCRLRYGNSIALDISADWIWKFCCL